MRHGSLPQAETLYRQILSIVPDNPEAMHGMGMIALAVNRPDVALGLLTQLIARLPDNPAVHFSLGNAQLAIGQLDDAITSYQRAIGLRLDFDDAHCNLGTALQQAGRLDQAIESFQRTIALRPDSAVAYNNLGNALQQLGRFREAIAAHRRSIELNPNSSDTYGHLAADLMENGQIEEAITVCRQGLAINPNSAGAYTNLVTLLAFDPKIDPQTIYQEHRRWNDRFARPLASQIQPHGNDRAPDRRLRIGYISPDLREHPVAYFLEGLIKSHAPASVETFCYADQQVRAGADRDRLQRHAQHWRNITGLSDQRVVEMVREDQIDILVDLAGHTGGNRLLVFARRPAPIQITYLGYPNTTGLDAIDYCLTDAFADPPGMTEQFYSEELVRLPDAFACYQPPDDATQETGSAPAAANGCVTFGSVNKLSKINLAVIECWAQILTRVPDSRLLMMARGLDWPATARRLRDAFAQHGIGADRLQLMGQLSRADYFAAHQQIDIMLDPFPVNGHTTTCHALWMGVPVITLAGKTRISRLGASVLKNLALDGFIAADTAEYVEIAQRLARNISALTELHQSLRGRMSRSALMDHGRFACHFEQALRGMWRRYCGADNL